ncbi:MAG TPA: YfhO family protein [Anaerolineales bacterium]|nr:YfhO family protein [Anaerolineales bacterium]
MRLGAALRGIPVWLWIVPLVLIGPALLPGRAIYFGTVSLQFHPWRVLAWRTLLAGELPLWNPLSGMGSPLLANYQSALLYPPTWLLFVFGLFGGEQAMAYGQGWLVVLHLVLAGWGAARLARELGLPAISQGLVGLAYGCSGYLVARSHFLSINAAAAWLPWVLFWVYRLVLAPARGRAGAVVGLALVVALLLLAGHAQTAWYTLLLAVIWFWFLLSRPEIVAHSHNTGEQSPGEDAPVEAGPSKLQLRLALLRDFAGAFAAAALIAAAQLLPTIELLIQSQRSGGVDETFAMTYSFWPWRLLGLFAPGLFGSPATGDYWGYGNYWEDAVYIGLIPVALAFQAVRRHIRSGARAPLVRFLLAITLVSFVFALGSNTPVFPFLFRYVPSFNVFQAPARFTLWAVLCLALLAGIGAADWAAAQSSFARQRARRWSAAGFALILSGAVTLIFLPVITATFGRAVLITGVFATAASLFGTARTKGARWRTTVLAVTALDLAIAGWGLNPATGLQVYSALPPPVETASGERIYLSETDIYSLTFDDYYRFDTFDVDLEGLRATMLPNLNILDGIATANQFDPLEVGRYRQWMAILESARPELKEWMLAESGVTAVGRGSGSGMVAFESRVAAPRVQWFPCFRSSQNQDQALQMVLSRNLEFENFLVLEGHETQAAWVCGGEEGAAAVGNAEILSDEMNGLIIQAGGPSAGVLLVRDLFYPGWTAVVDGEQVEVLPANHSFRAIPVPAGDHVIEVRYRPTWFYLGAVLSLAGLGSVIYISRRSAGKDL